MHCNSGPNLEISGVPRSTLLRGYMCSAIASSLVRFPPLCALSCPVLPCLSFIRPCEYRDHDCCLLFSLRSPVSTLAAGGFRPCFENTAFVPTCPLHQPVTSGSLLPDLLYPGDPSQPRRLVFTESHHRRKVAGSVRYRRPPSVCLPRSSNSLPQVSKSSPGSSRFSPPPRRSASTMSPAPKFAGMPPKASAMTPRGGS